MEKYISYEKLTKKKQREMDKQQRGSWGAINPVTRKSDDGNKYNRKKARQWNEDVPHAEPFLYPNPFSRMTSVLTIDIFIRHKASKSKSQHDL